MGFPFLQCVLGPETAGAGDGQPTLDSKGFGPKACWKLSSGTRELYPEANGVWNIMELKGMSLLLIKKLALSSHEPEKISQTRSDVSLNKAVVFLLETLLFLFSSWGLHSYCPTACCSSRYHESDVRCWSGAKYKGPGWGMNCAMV